MPTVEFAGYVLLVVMRVYPGGSPAITLTLPDGEPFMTASVNLGVGLPDGCIAIKDWSENEGIFDALVNAGIIEDAGYSLPSGFVEAKIAKLLV